MKILVTGATGRIGANLVKRLVEDGHQLRCLVRPGSKRAHKLKAFPVEILEVDLKDRDALPATLAGMEAVAHVGAELSPDPDDAPRADFEANLASTFYLLDAIRKKKLDIKTFVFTSSIVVYNDATVAREPIGEDEATLDVEWIYSAGKVGSEALCNAFFHTYKIPTMSLRLPFVFAGKELLEVNGFFTVFIEGRLNQLRDDGRLSAEQRRCREELDRNFKTGKKLVIPLNSDGSAHKRHHCDVRDAAEAIALALQKPEAAGSTMNIMSQPLHYDVAVKHLAELTGIEYCELRWHEDFSYEFSLERAKKLIGYTPQYDSLSMVEDALKHQRGEDVGIITA